jgi:DNA-binding CsgD family transcriptional regulator/Tol biopolymer transport system component
MEQRLHTDFGWTKRQREVLSLLTAGKTNADIAAALSISRDGAKWHVAEILSKLHASSREEAAEYWRRYNGMAPRFARVFRALIASTATHWIAGGAASGAIVAALILGGAALRGASEAPISNTSSTPTPAPTASPAPVLSDGTEDYDYTPELAYVGTNGAAWMADGTDGRGRVALMDNCTRNQTLKAAFVFTASLAWSANGQRVGCQDSNAATTSQAVDEPGSDSSDLGSCDSVPSWAPDGRHVACQMADHDGPRLHIFDMNGQTTAVIENSGPQFSWSPSGEAVLTMIEPKGNRLALAVTTVSGERVTTITDAYAMPPDIQWTRDGSRLAYPGTDGAVVIDVATGARQVTPRSRLPATVENGQDLWTGGIHVDWVLHDSALLVHRYTYAALIDLSSSSVTTLPPEFGGAIIAPDGIHGWSSVGASDGTGWDAVIVNLETRSSQPIPGSYQRYTMSTGPMARFSGDSGRVCWAPSPGNHPDIFCANTAGGPAVKVAAPVQVEPDALGSGDFSILWRAFSPDFTRIAYTMPGPESEAKQTLYVADLDGSNVVSLGPVFGAIPYRWQPDGVYQAPPRIQ